MRTVLRSPAFRLLFGGLFASILGESVLLLALAIWMKDITGSNGMAGATLLAVVAPTVFAPVIGWVVDRFRRRPFLVWANIVTAVCLAPLLFVRDRDDVWIIYTVAVLYGLSNIAIVSALNGLIKEVVPEELLADANGALQTVRQALRLLGPLVGAGLYTAVGGWVLAVIAAVGFVIAATAIAAIRVVETAPGPSQLRWLAEVAAGVRQVTAQPALRRITIGVASILLLLGFTETLIFAYVDEGLHRPPAFVGVLVTVQSIGGVAGGLLAARMVRRLGEIGAAAVGLLAFAPFFVAVAYPSLLTALPTIALAGASFPPLVVALNTLMQRVTPAELLGRTGAALEALLSGPQALSIAAGAILVSYVDYRLLFAAIGVSLLTGGIYLWRGRHLSAPQPAAPALAAPAPDVPAQPSTAAATLLPGVDPVDAEQVQ